MKNGQSHNCWPHASDSCILKERVVPGTGHHVHNVCGYGPGKESAPNYSLKGDVVCVGMCFHLLVPFFFPIVAMDSCDIGPDFLSYSAVCSCSPIHNFFLALPTPPRISIQRLTNRPEPIWGPGVCV